MNPNVLIICVTVIIVVFILAAVAYGMWGKVMKDD